MKMPKIDMLKVVGFIGTGLGVAATLLSGYVSDKQLEKKVSTEVAKALAEKMTKEAQ